MALSKNWRRAILLSALAATVVKIFLALRSSGSLDVFAFNEFLTNIREVGGIGTYYRRGLAGNPFTYLPFMIHAVRGMGFLADATHLPFRFWLRFPSVLADLGTLFLIWKMAERLPALKLAPVGLLLVAVYPGSILISGFHGNTDALMIFFLLLSVYLLAVKRLPWLAGAAFGMALNIKIVPLVFAPAIFLFLPDLRTRLKFFGAATAVVFVASLPYLLQDPLVIWKTVFGHRSLYGTWGWTWLVVNYLANTPPPSNGYEELTGVHRIVEVTGRYVMFACITAASFWMNLRRHKPPLFLQCGFIAFMLLFMTTGFGIQYLAWLTPWIIVLGVWSAGLYYVVSACYITLSYSAMSAAVRRVLDLPPLWPGNVYFVAELACWLSVLVALVNCWRLLRNYENEAGSLADERGLSLPEETRAAAG
jgi:hypothetical protein